MQENGQLFVSLISDFGALGFVFWMTWRNTNYTIPRLAKQFENAINQQRNDFKEMQTQFINFFHKELETERRVKEIHVTNMIEAFKDARQK